MTCERQRVDNGTRPLTCSDAGGKTGSAGSGPGVTEEEAAMIRSRGAGSDRQIAFNGPIYGVWVAAEESSSLTTSGNGRCFNTREVPRPIGRGVVPVNDVITKFRKMERHMKSSATFRLPRASSHHHHRQSTSHACVRKSRCPPGPEFSTSMRYAEASWQATAGDSRTAPDTLGRTSTSHPRRSPE